MAKTENPNAPLSKFKSLAMLVDNQLVYACRRRRKKKISKWVKDHRFLADQFVSIVQDCPKDKDQ